MDFLFFLNSALLGLGLAMDAFSVSLADGLENPGMPRRRMCLIAGVFAVFQAAMPLLGWVCVHTAATYFQAFQKWIPWISLALLSFLGGKMVFEGLRNRRAAKTAAAGESGTEDAPREEPAVAASPRRPLSFRALLLQGIATSIDALSVGFTIASDPLPIALAAVTVIGAVTFFVCLAGVYLGRKCGTHLSDWAAVFGGGILIFIGLEIFLQGIFGG